MNYNIDELIKMAEQDAHTIVIRSGASNCSMSIVYNVNGKRMSFSKSLATQLGVTNEIYLLPVKEANTLILSAKPIGSKSSVSNVIGEGKKICYSAQLCKALVETFELNYDLSRFARNTIDAGLYTADLEDRDIDIISVTQEFSPTPEGHLLTHFMHGINQYFSENLAKFSFAGMKTTALKGHHCGGVPPLGYDVGEDKKLHINEWEADAVRLIFNMYEQHFSYSQMADRLNELGYHTKTGQPFKKNSFDSILKQEKYCGIYIWNKSSAKNSKGHRNTHHDKPEQDQVRIQDEIPVIISKEQFDRVQALAATRTRGNCATNYRHFYLFSGMDVITCGACGSKMVGKTDTRSGKRYYYCPKHKQKSCHVVDIRADHIENFVINHLISDISSRSDLVDIFNDVNNDAEIKKLEYHLRGVKTAMTNTMKAIEAGFTPELNTKLRTLSADKELVEARIAELTSQQEYMTEEDRKAVCKKLAKFLKDATSYEAKQYIRSVLKSVVVFDAGVEVTLNIA